MNKATHLEWLELPKHPPIPVLRCAKHLGDGDALELDQDALKLGTACGTCRRESQG